MMGMRIAFYCSVLHRLHTEELLDCYSRKGHQKAAEILHNLANAESTDGSEAQII